MARILYTIVLVACLAAPSLAGDHALFTARAGIDLATDAARSWAHDARLIYVENDEDVAGDGTAQRWGYLFHSNTSIS